MISDVFYVWTGKIAYVLLGILAASIAGTLSYLVWLFLERGTAKFHVRVAMPFLRMILACFLVPVVPFVVYIFVKGLELGEEIVLIPTFMAILLLVVVPVCVFTMFAIAVHRYWEYRKKLFMCRDNVPIEDERYLAILTKWCERLDIRKNVKMSYNEHVESPAILYYKGYQIVIPTFITDEQEMNMAILHELVHLKHGDLVVKQIGEVANVLHAFNPYIYKLRKDIERWAEVDCDLATCEFGKVEFDRKEYFECLMNLKERSQEKFGLKEMCGFAEDQDLINFRVEAMKQLTREEMTTPITGYLLTLFFLVVVTVGSLWVSNNVYLVWFKLLMRHQEETLDTSLPEISTIEIFSGTKLVYSEEKIFNRETSLDFSIGPKETWIFDISEENVNTVFISIISGDGLLLAGGIGENKQVITVEFFKYLSDNLAIDNSNIQQIFIQNPEMERVKVELLVGTE